MADPQVPGPAMIVLGSSTRDVVLAAGKVMGKSAAQMEPYVAYLLREEWLETCLDLRDTSADRDAWANLKIPARLKLKIKQIVQAAPDGDAPSRPSAEVRPSAAGGTDATADTTAAGGLWGDRRVPPLRVGGVDALHGDGSDSPTDLPSARNPTPNTPPYEPQRAAGFANPDNPSPLVPTTRAPATAAAAIVTSPVLSASDAEPARGTPDDFQLSSPAPPPSVAWRMAIDSSTQLPYFYNTVTGESQWETPEELASPEHGGGGITTADDGGFAPDAHYDASGSYEDAYTYPGGDAYGEGVSETGGARADAGYDGTGAAVEPEPAPARLEPRAPNGPPPHLRHLATGHGDYSTGVPSPIVSSGFGSFGQRSSESDALIAKAAADFEAAVAASLRHDSARAARVAASGQHWPAAAPNGANARARGVSTDSKGEEAVVADVVAQPQPALRKWQCMVCTYLNQARSKRCAMCGAKQPELEAAMRPASELITTGVPLGQFRSAAFSFARHKRNADLKALIANKVVTPFEVDEHGNTLLIVAAQNGNSSTVKMLLKLGVNVNARNKKNRSAFDFAVQFGFQQVAAQLLMHGAVDANVPFPHTTRLGSPVSAPSTAASPSPRRQSATRTRPSPRPASSAGGGGRSAPQRATAPAAQSSPTRTPPPVPKRRSNANPLVGARRRLRPIAGGVVPGAAELDHQDRKQAEERKRAHSDTRRRSSPVGGTRRSSPGGNQTGAGAGPDVDGGSRPDRRSSWRHRFFGSGDTGASGRRGATASGSGDRDRRSGTRRPNSSNGAAPRTTGAGERRSGGRRGRSPVGPGTNGNGATSGRGTAGERVLGAAAADDGAGLRGATARARPLAARGSKPESETPPGDNRRTEHFRRRG